MCTIYYVLKRGSHSMPAASLPARQLTLGHAAISATVCTKIGHG
jgi:hypothetical protein